MSVFPYWLELVRACAALLIWVLTPLMIWFTVWSVRQHQKWEAGKLERYERWKQGMEEVARNREEALKIRSQAEVTLAHAEVALAQARRHRLMSTEDTLPDTQPPESDKPTFRTPETGETAQPRFR